MVRAQSNQSFSDRTAAGIKGPPGAAERLSLRSLAPALERVAATRARATSVLARGGKVLGLYPPPAQPACPLQRSARGGRGRGGPAPLTHHLQPPSRARSKSQDFEPGHWSEGRGGSTWGSAAWPGAGPQPLPVSAAAGRRAGDPQPAAVAWPPWRRPCVRRPSRLLPACRASGRVRGNSARPCSQSLASLSRCTAPPPPREGSLFSSRSRGSGASWDL